ncbi:MAG: SDR family NAD(P)-dependent oxidoreductase [Alphaproteobacteria bacterium]|nr:SDR family NAD(P)-dependent oxidoreductase [Alphaproteobacteria bacterium]
MDLKGKVALVTGGNGGLGQRICRALAAAGAHIAVVCGSNIETAEKVANDVRSLGVEAGVFKCDLQHPAEIDKMVADVVDRFGRIDILVNDAAFNKAIPFDDLDALDLEIWNKIMTINLTAPLLTCKAVAPIMKRQGQGRIVNITSVAGFAPSGSSIAYAVSKAGLNHLTKCMAVALAPEVLVNGVAPGLIEGTQLTARLRPEQIERANATALLKKPADKDDIANQVVTMCRTDTMTGQTIVIDAGRVFH